MSQLSYIESDRRVLKEDYCNYDLIAAAGTTSIAAGSGRTSSASPIARVRPRRDHGGPACDRRRHPARQARAPRQEEAHTAGDRDAIIGIEPKLSRAQKMMLAIHSKSRTSASPSRRSAAWAITRAPRRLRRLRRGRPPRLRRTRLQSGQPQEDHYPASRCSSTRTSRSAA